LDSRLPLHRYPAVHTSDVEEAADIFSRMTTPATFQKVERDAPFEWRANLLSLGVVQISAHAHGAGFYASTDAVQDIFTTSFPLVDVPSAGFDAGREMSVVKDERTWLVSPDRPGAIRVGTGYRALQLTFHRADVEMALASLVGVASVPSLHMDPTLGLSSGVGAWLRRLTQYIVDEADEHAGLAVENPFASPLVRARLGDTILYGILAGHPHNHSARLASHRAAEPAYVRRAAEYLDAHALDPIRLADLARIAGVGVRALQLGFQKYRRCTPMAFLRERRLQSARRRLLAEAELTVTRVALDCGFEHVGRFSRQYSARFGESPSETRALVKWRHHDERLRRNARGAIGGRDYL
jgi:AraC-like DNA-binding protein